VQADQLTALQRLRSLLEVTRLVGTDRSLDSVLAEMARTISESLGFRGVVINLYRPAWDDFVVSTVHGSDSIRDALLGEVYSWDVWLVALHERFERRGAYFVPHGAIDWDDPALGARHVPEMHTGVDNAWIPGDELFVPCRHSDGHLLGIISVGEPVSGMRPSDEQLDLLVAMASLAAHALQSAQEAVEAARHRDALEQLFTISSRLPESGSADAMLQAVCDGVASALDFLRVSIELVDPATGLLTPRAAAGWSLAEAPHWDVSVDEIRPLLDPAFEVEGCFLVPADAAARLTRQRVGFSSTMNGRGPQAWDHHWLLVPLYDSTGEIVGRIWADEPADRMLPSPSRLQALRVFANQATMAIVAAGHLEQLRALADQDPLTSLLNRRAFMRELGSELERMRRYGRGFALAIGDLDDFKAINDAHGHPAGDRALQRVAAILGAELRTTDVAFRIGGDEFALLLPETRAAEAAEAVRRVAAAVNAGGPDLRQGIGISFGIALCPDHGIAPDELIRRADEALYEAKRERGGIRFAGAAA
jgi:diguanylate cyclase (GGDEF)-like protein